MSFNILSIDGGGIKGVIPLVMLARVEEIIRHRRHGQVLEDYFQMVAGTSTGSIVAAGLAVHKRPEELLRIYREHGLEIFPIGWTKAVQRLGLTFSYGVSSPRYSPQALRRLLRQELGEVRVAEVNNTIKLLIPFYDTLTRSARFIKSYSTGDHRTPRFGGVSLWEAALCSSSAPTYFPAHELVVDGEQFSAIDGGVAANNPTACAVADALALGVNPREIRVLSLGTGASTRPIPLESAQEWGILEWAKPVIDILFDGAEDVTRYIVEHVLGREQVLRLQFDLRSRRWGQTTLSDDLDDASSANVNGLIGACEMYLEHEGLEKLERFLG